MVITKFDAVAASKAVKLALRTVIEEALAATDAVNKEAERVMSAALDAAVNPSPTTIPRNCKAIEDLEDVTNTYSNFDIDESVLNS